MSKNNCIRFCFGILINVMVLLSWYNPVHAQQKVKLFHAQDVRLRESIFKNAENTDINYLLALNPDRLLSPFLRESGLVPKAVSYPNWENTGLDGHTGGHYLSALSLMFAATGNQKIGERLHYMLAELQKCQDKNGNGYIGGVPGGNDLWNHIAKGDIDAGTFSLNKKWVPLYNIHKIYAGLRDAFLYTGNLQAKEMLLKYSKWFLWLTSGLTDQQIQKMLIAEHGGLNEVFADVYAITRNKQYLKLAYKFSDQHILLPLAQQRDELNGMHANTQIPKVIGFERIAALNADSTYHRAADFFYRTVTQHRTLANGGNSVREHFNPTNDFSGLMSSVEGPETCNSYNMLKLAKSLYEHEGLPGYIDYYEGTLYNHILSSQHPGKGGFVYFTPMRAGHYRVYSQVHSGFWCCVGSGMENHAKYNELIYAYNEEGIYVNLFIPSVVNWKKKNIQLSQKTDFPETGQTILNVKMSRSSLFTIHVRYPKWVKAGAMKILVNGQQLKVSGDPGQYISIKRTWKNGDVVKVVLPMNTKTVQLPDHSNFAAVMHGPILLAAKTDSSDLMGLFADHSRMGHIAGGKQRPLAEMPLFVSNDRNLAVSISPVPGKTLAFKAASLIYPEEKKDMELIPFYKLHDSRYIIYWQTVTKDSLKLIQASLAAAEKEKAELQRQTLDLVFPGEQQPESDHFIEMEGAQSGIFEDRHYRSAKGWFSYEMDYKGRAAGSLKVLYHGKNKAKKFKITVNDILLADEIFEENKNGVFYTKDYQIPPEVFKSSPKKLKVKFIAAPGSETAAIYEVRLVK